jgi:tRNA pseudouridine55 synthase
MEMHAEPQFSVEPPEADRRPASALWLAEKPVGPTSFDLVKQFRRPLEGPWHLKVSHGGALDPFARGLMLLLVGSATRLFEHLHAAPKVYRAQVRWGLETETGDAGGQAVAGPGGVPTPEAAAAALQAFLGWTEQVPPATSNKRVDGERAYRLAHRGEAVTLPPCRVYLHDARWTEHQGGASTLELTVRGGFYVRSLVRDLGRALGTGAHVAALDRLSIGPWAAPGPSPRQLVGPAVLPWLPRLALSDAAFGALRQGAPPPGGTTTPAAWPLPAGFPSPGEVALTHLERLVGVARGEAVTLFPGGI